MSISDNLNFPLSLFLSYSGFSSSHFTKICVRSTLRHWQFVDEKKTNRCDQTNFRMSAVVLRLILFNIAQLIVALSNILVFLSLSLGYSLISLKRSTVRFHDYVSLIKRRRLRRKKSIIIFSWSMRLYFRSRATSLSQHSADHFRTNEQSRTIRLTCRGFNRIYKWIYVETFCC